MSHTDAALRAACRLLSSPRDLVHTGMREAVSWTAVADLAAAHGVGPLLYSSIKQSRLTVPPEPLERLRRSYYQTARNNALRFDELHTVVTMLSQAGIHPILLKGAALADSVYGNLALRPMADLDLLVPRERIIDVPPLLEALGYQLHALPPGHNLDYHARFTGEISLRKAVPASGIILDVHWHLLDFQWLHHSTRINMDQMWEAARPLTTAGISALALSPEDTLLHLCLHAGYGHAYAYLLHLVDIDRFIRSNSSWNWEFLLARTNRLQVRNPVYFGLRLATELLATPIPGAVTATLRPSALRCAIVDRLAGPSPNPTDTPPPVPSQESYLLQLALIDSLAGLLRSVRFAFLPGAEWLAARHPEDDAGNLQASRLGHVLRRLRSALTTAATIARRRR